MEEKTKNKDVKKIAIIVAVSIAVVACLAGAIGVSYNIAMKKNNKAVEVLSQGETKEEQTEDVNVSIEETPEVEEIEITEEQVEKAEEKDQEEVIQITEEEKKKQKEVEKKQEEEQKKKQEETNQNYKYLLKVNYTANTVTAYQKDENNAYTIPVRAMICSTGSATPRSGVFKTKNKYRWKLLIGNSYGQYSTRITGQILFHSVPYESQSPDSLITRYYDKLGITTSLGCIRLTVSDAKWIYENCPLGTSVEFYSSTNPGPLGKPSATKISGAGSPYNRWDPTDPDPNNPWRTKNEEKQPEPVQEETPAAPVEEKPQVTVPDVMGKMEAEAKQVLSGYNITVKYETQTSGDDGVVIRQENNFTEGNTAVTGIVLTVRKVENKIEVPNVVGLKVSNAKETLANFVVGDIIYQNSTPENDGVVIAQSVPAGSKVEKGSYIKLTVGKYKEPEPKTATVIIPLRTLTEYKGVEDLKKAKVKVLVDDKIVYNKDIDNSTESVPVQITGLGKVKLKVLIDEKLYEDSEFDFSSGTNIINVREK